MAQIQISGQILKSSIKRHLSIIGKRLYSKEGKNMFSDITLSSAEEGEILSQYIKTSAHDIESVLKQLITQSTVASDITISIENKRGDADFEIRVTDMIAMYIVLNTVGEYLSMAHPELAQKYQRDAQQRLQSLVLYVYSKKSSITSTDFTDPTGTVINN